MVFRIKFVPKAVGVLAAVALSIALLTSPIHADVLPVVCPPK